MNSTEVIILAGSLILVSLIAYYSIKLIVDKNRHNAILIIFNEILPKAIIEKSTEKFYEYHFEYSDKLFLIKVLPFDLHHELIITNKYYWCMNADLKGWKRSTVPDLFSGVKEFVEYNPLTKLKVVKIALIMPDCHNIIRYLNESDVAKVLPSDLVYGVYFVKAVELQSFFPKTE